MNTYKFIRIASGGLALLLLSHLSMKLVKAPGKAMIKIEKSNPKPGADSVYFPLLNDTLLKEYVYKKALLELASQDSIHMVLNLADSQANLYIHGVQLFATKLTHLKNDPLLEKFSNKLYATTFSHPLPIETIESTIVKEPIVERQAPKDTIEAALNAYMPDTLIQYPAFLRFRLENGINIHLEQALNKNMDAKLTRWEFYYDYRLEQWHDRFNCTFSGKPVTYHPDIVVKLNVDDLRAIYRALPNRKPLIVIKY